MVEKVTVAVTIITVIHFLFIYVQNYSVETNYMVSTSTQKQQKTYKVQNKHFM
jgi:hypothetical protein